MASNRRDFMKKTLIGISGALMVSNRAHGENIYFGSKDLQSDLPSRILGKTGIRIPLISLGTSGITNSNFIRTAYNAGIRVFFSATYYGEGNNEILVGQGLRNFPRDSYVVATAAPAEGLDMRTGALTEEFNADVYLKKAEDSLKRFGLDYIDIFVFPGAGKRETLLNRNLLDALTKLKNQGKVKFLGIASHANTEEAIDAALEAGIFDVAMISYNFKVPKRESLDAVIDRAAKAGMGIVAMKTTAGAFREKGGFPLNTNAALKWVLQNENISCIVSGMRTIEELEKNLKMIQDLKMTDQEINDLQASLISSETGLYCLQCQKCLEQCQQDIDVPTIMRSYMYAYGYKDPELALYTLESAKLHKVPCMECDTCSVTCSAGFNIKEKVLDIVRLQKVPREFIVNRI